MAPVAQGARLALDQRQVVLPVVDDVIAIDGTDVLSHHVLVGHDHHLLRVQPYADAMARQSGKAPSSDCARPPPGSCSTPAPATRRSRRTASASASGVAVRAPRFPDAHPGPSGCGADHACRTCVASHALSSAKLPKRSWPASSQIRRRASCTPFSTRPFSPTRGDVAEVGVEQVMRRHRRKARSPRDRGPCAASGRPPSSCCRRCRGGRHRLSPRGAARVRVEEHFVALAGIGHQPEGARCTASCAPAYLAPDAADHEVLAPVKLGTPRPKRRSAGRRRRALTAPLRPATPARTR